MKRQKAGAIEAGEKDSMISPQRLEQTQVAARAPRGCRHDAAKAVRRTACSDSAYRSHYEVPTHGQNKPCMHMTAGRYAGDGIPLRRDAVETHSVLRRELGVLLGFLIRE